MGGERAVAQLEHVANDGEPVGGPAAAQHLEGGREGAGAAVVAVVDDGGAPGPSGRTWPRWSAGANSPRRSATSRDADAEAGGNGRGGGGIEQEVPPRCPKPDRGAPVGTDQGGPAAQHTAGLDVLHPPGGLRPASPNQWTGARLRAATPITRGSSALRMAAPSGGSASRSSALASAIAVLGAEPADMGLADVEQDAVRWDG